MELENAFIDTNVLVYAHDAGGGEKHIVANSIVTTIWEEGLYPFISPQVLKEFCSVLQRKGYNREDAWEIVSPYLWWNVVPETGDLIKEAASIQVAYQLSIWDACIIAAARISGATLVCTEDLNDGQDYGGVAAINPFAAGD